MALFADSILFQISSQTFLQFLNLVIEEFGLKIKWEMTFYNNSLSHKRFYQISFKHDTNQ